MMLRHDTVIVRLPERPGVKWELPKVMGTSENQFSNKCTWKAVRWGSPKKGEYYVSGAKPCMYKAPADLSQEHLVVELVQKMRVKSITVWEPDNR